LINDREIGDAQRVSNSWRTHISTFFSE